VVSFRASTSAIREYTVYRNLLPELYNDNVVRSHGRDVYILESHLKDNVIKYSLGSGNPVPVYQRSVGEGLNIHDIAAVSETKAYISCYQSGELIVFDPGAGEKISAIDLSEWNTYAGTDSAETRPYMSSLAVYGERLYVACQRLKNFVAADVSVIAIIDTRTDEAIGSIELRKKNPMSMHILGDRMLVSSSGIWGDPGSGGAEMIDLAENRNLGVVIDGSLLGGWQSGAALVSPNKAYVAVTDMSTYLTDIIEFDPSSGTVGRKVEGIEDGYGGIVYDGSRVYVGDRGFASAGVAVINPETNAVEQKIPTSMPPKSLAVVFGD
jgi:YVTN family beta-propeller protein